MEQYLIDEYDVYEDKWLTDESEIEDHFKDVGIEFFDCGQGYYEDNVDLICKINDKFYIVDMDAMVLGNKQDVGDRLYYVEKITEVRYKEIEKPNRKSKENVTYNLNLTAYQKASLESYMEELKIEF